MALLVFASAAARAGVVAPDLGPFPPHGLDAGVRTPVGLLRLGPREAARPAGPGQGLAGIVEGQVARRATAALPGGSAAEASELRGHGVGGRGTSRTAWVSSDDRRRR